MCTATLPRAASREAELARLIRSQARDASTCRLPPGRELRECDLVARGGPGLAGLAHAKGLDPSAAAEDLDLPDGALRPRWLLLGSSMVWGPAALSYDPRHRTRCPACGDTPPRRSACLICSRSSLDQRPWPNAKAPPESPAPPPRRASGKRLAGGTGTTPKAWSHWMPPGDGAPDPDQFCSRSVNPVNPATRPRKATAATTHVRVRLLVPLLGHRPGDLVEVRASIASTYLASGAAERVR